MNRFVRAFFVLMSLFMGAGLGWGDPLSGESLPKDILVKETLASITVRAAAPIPSEVMNETQGLALAREAAVMLAQTRLLTTILTKKTASKKTLAEAEIPSLALQGEVRAFIRGAEVTKTVYREGK